MTTAREVMDAATAQQAMSDVRMVRGAALIRFSVTARPVPKARPRVVDGHAYTPAKTLAFEAAIGYAAGAAMRRSNWPTAYAGRVMVDVVVTGARANSDIDNLLKSILDGMNGIVYADDHQVAGCAVWREDKGMPGVRVEVVALEEVA